jgi:DeoR/GlpR family transcriptional regulator of sugar metabolism
LAIITVLAGDPDITLEIIGGTYTDAAYSLRGSLAEKMLEDLHFDILFLGADAIDEEGRCMAETAEEARLTQIMMRRSSRRILLADHTKVGRNGYLAFGRLSDFTEWISSRAIEGPGTAVSDNIDRGDIMKAFSGMTRITLT